MGIFCLENPRILETSLLTDTNIILHILVGYWIAQAEELVQVYCTWGLFRGSEWTVAAIGAVMGSSCCTNSFILSYRRRYTKRPCLYHPVNEDNFAAGRKKLLFY